MKTSIKPKKNLETVYCKRLEPALETFVHSIDRSGTQTCRNVTPLPFEELRPSGDCFDFLLFKYSPNLIPSN